MERHSSLGPSPKLSAAAVLACAIVFASGPAAIAEVPEAATVIGKMKTAMEPSRPSVRDVDIITTGADGYSVTWKAEQARGMSHGVPAVLTVMISPDDVKGNAVLIREERSGGDQEWMYISGLRRIRKLQYGLRSESFLGTDLSHEDLGFVSPRDRYYEFLRTEKYRDKDAYVIREVPADPSMYSRVEMWINAESYLPMKREYYDRAGLLWKVADYDDAVVIDGLPTIPRLVVKDKQAGGGTEMKLENIRYGISIPDAMLSPDGLPGAAESPLWRKP
jgi:outer membrane lipoprotein-sorting protein